MGTPMFSSKQAEDMFRAKLGEVVEGGRWMAAVWKVVDGKIELANVTSFNFPDGDFLPAVGQLALKCHEEMIEKNRPSLPQIPLPPAFAPRPREPFRIMRKDALEGDGESKLDRSTGEPCPQDGVEMQEKKEEPE